MASNRRTVDAKAVDRVVQHFDYVPASQVRQIIERYVYEMWVTQIARNPYIQELVKLKVGGPSIPWDRTIDQRNGRSSYLQSADRYRAQALLGDDNARWEVYRDLRNGYNRVRRVR